MIQLKNRMPAVTLLLLLTAIGIIEVLPKAKPETLDQEMARIEKLHQQDIAATLSGDPKALTDLWTDDGILLEPGGQAKIGKQFIGTEVQKWRAEHAGMKILSYVPEVKEIKITDGWVYEWGYFSSS